MFELDVSKYKPPSPKKKPRTKRNKTRSNGRGPSFDNCQAKINAYLIQHPAFQSLNASAIRVLLMAIVKHENAKYNMRRDGNGRYVWTFTYADGKKYCGLSNSSISKALLVLEELGFLQVTIRGGLKGANGVMSQYTLSEDWKSWTPDILEEPLKKQRATLPVWSGLTTKPLYPSGVVT